MGIEQRVKTKLLMRGFSKETLLNNRGLIGATTDETIGAFLFEIYRQIEKYEKDHSHRGIITCDVADVYGWLGNAERNAS